jgi:hypothetical protein
LQAYELKTSAEIFVDMSAFVLGNFVFISLAFLYFFPTNKNIFNLSGISESEMERKLKRRRAGQRYQKEIERARFGLTKWRVDTYITHRFKINLTREPGYYDLDLLQRVFYQNHVNASFFEALIVLAFFFIGAFQYNSFFIIPAAASACLVFTVVLMAISIVMSWLKGWTLTVLITLFLVLNFISGEWDFLNKANYAYGLDYEKPPVAYTMTTIDSLNNDLRRVKEDKEHHIRTLERWVSRERKEVKDQRHKPKMIIINTSGGGLRSTMWTLRVMQFTDSLLQGGLIRNTPMITGSSGGIIGATYFRELILRKDSIEEGIYHERHLDYISNDLLNRVLFTFATNDIFIRFRKTEIASHSYTLDRATTFEDQLVINSNGILNGKVSDYRDPVARGEIPMIIMAPSVVNDGRRLLISSQPMAYMSYDYPELREELNLTSENIEFNRMFANHGADDLLLTSALRMNSTFPYILPYANLPTDPEIQVMDAGLRDNLGTKITAQYLYTFQEWIEENTSGVIILQIRDTEKMAEPSEGNDRILSKLTNPIGSFYGNFFHDQDYNMDQLLKITSDWLEVPLYQIPLEMRYREDEHIALSWHLSAFDKKKISNAIFTEYNQNSLTRLQELMQP